MRVVTGWPPNIARIREALAPQPNTVFAYGDNIFSPHGPEGIDALLIVHESVHRDQQEAIGGPEAWWDRYIDDAQFRLEQEVEAYRAQYRASLGMPFEQRQRFLSRLARDLAGPMYGSLITRNHARGLIKRAA